MRRRGEKRENVTHEQRPNSNVSFSSHCRSTHRVCQTVELLSEHTSSSPPPGNLAVQEIKDCSKEGTPECQPSILCVISSEIARREEEGLSGAKGIHDGEGIG